MFIIEDSYIKFFKIVFVFVECWWVYGVCLDKYFVFGIEVGDGGFWRDCVVVMVICVGD